MVFLCVSFIFILVCRVGNGRWCHWVFFSFFFLHAFLFFPLFFFFSSSFGSCKHGMPCRLKGFSLQSVFCHTNCETRGLFLSFFLGFFFSFSFFWFRVDIWGFFCVCFWLVSTLKKQNSCTVKMQ
ncbi:hypothetical protein BZA05DRAFT_410543 [Tricharina praecox]|uniref:uncharacterized protein n=1 Tax=Tricharina praecox TaxID=43433 RepID=UPI0022203F3E|nr:uncharacterized protein BZA05DRAFT_410543 [Tricharina praecox]KAI5843748.1 hypothetical protein BZA05DRAFT_410543 [Tricharina praecox]